MADPTIDGAYRVLAVFESSSGLPADQVVNSWAFQRVGANDAATDAAAIADALETFYTALDDRYSSGSVSAGLTVKVYDLSQPPPRQPLEETRTFTPGAGSTSMLPREVAACMSFYAGISTPRTRGRLFLGPLAGDAVETSTGRPGDRSISATFRQVIASAANALVSDSTVDWSVLSQANANIASVTQGWIDDAPDTVRSRGLAATTRTLFFAGS